MYLECSTSLLWGREGGKSDVGKKEAKEEEDNVRSRLLARDTHLLYATATAIAIAIATATAQQPIR